MRKVYISSHFEEQFNVLPRALQKKVRSVITLLHENDFPVNLKVHMLKGELAGIYSCSVDNSHRIIFEVIENNDLELLLVGDHSIYRQGI